VTRAQLGAAIAVAGAVAGVVVVASIGGDGGEAAAASTRTQVACGDTTPYTVFYSGRRLGGLKLSGSDSTCERRRRVGVPSSDVSFFYGRCRAGPAPCLPPVQVISEPLVECHARRPRQRLRGVPARIARDGYSIELYTGRTAVTIVGTSPRRVRRAARRLASAPRRLIPRPPRARLSTRRPAIRPYTRLPRPNRADMARPNDCA
jgi:hypothetical protein